jgi:hypothetical protein
MSKLGLLLTAAYGLQATGLAVNAQQTKEAPKLNRAPLVEYDLRGTVREYVDAVTQQWLLKMPDANPAILEMFASRDQKPPRDLLPWSGEFAGKYLTGAVQVLRLTRDPELKAYVGRFVSRLVQLQAEDGYLGPFPPDNRLEGKNGTWDAWGHYHVMLGLLLWHEETGDRQALASAVKIGDLLCRKFLHSGQRLVDTGNAEMNHAPIHSLCLLYRITGTSRYLELAQQIVEEFQDPRAGDYLRSALAGKEFFQCPKPRWESLHPIQGLAELHWITGNKDYRKAFEHLWWSIAKLDRHNNGGFSSGEQAQGNPYHPGAIETCCTVAWIAMSIDMLRLSQDSVVADELELSTLNQVLGYQHPSGKHCTYNTPMDGVRRKSTEEIGFQIRPGSEEINCCSANAPRGFGMISDWALMSDGEGLVLNWYGPGRMRSRVEDTRVALRQETQYPRDGTIALHVEPERELRFPLKLRIPHWSAQSRVTVNGEPVPDVRPGAYLLLEREWKPGDRVEIMLDMSLHFWVGERDCAGKSSIYRGPLLLVHERPGGKPPTLQFSSHWKAFGSLHAAKDVGASFETSFEGTAVVWEGKRFDDAGRAQVLIDGREVAVVDQFGPGRELPFSWEYTDLQPGRHSLKVTVLDDHNTASKDRWINVTSINVPDGRAPVFDAARLDPTLAASGRGDGALLQMEVSVAGGDRVLLRDYGTAGVGGVPYRSWLEVQNINFTPFSATNPLRSGRFPGSPVP